MTKKKTQRKKAPAKKTIPNEVTISLTADEANVALMGLRSVPVAMNDPSFQHIQTAHAKILGECKKLAAMQAEEINRSEGKKT